MFKRLRDRLFLWRWHKEWHSYGRPSGWNRISAYNAACPDCQREDRRHAKQREKRERQERMRLRRRQQEEADWAAAARRVSADRVRGEERAQALYKQREEAENA